MRACVAAGGGSKGCFEVGVANYTMGEMGRDYDVFLGTSVGSINGSGYAMFEKGQDVEAAAFVNRLWTGLRQSDVAKKRFLSPLALAWSSSMEDTAPLRAYLEETLVTPLKRPFYCNAVDLVTGQTRLWTHECGREDLIDGIMASSAAPILYPPVWRGPSCLLVDGGIRDVSMLEQAIRLGAEEIDVWLPESKAVNRWEPKSDKVWHTGPRVLELMLNEIIEGDLKKTDLYNKLVVGGVETEKRFVKVNVIRPESPLPIDSAKFDHETIMKGIRIGEETAKKFWDKAA